jgi:hypothetical protein
MYAIVTLDTENQLNNLVSVMEAGANSDGSALILIQSSKAVKADWFGRAEAIFRQHGVKEVEKIHLVGDEVNDIALNTTLIKDQLLKMLQSEPNAYIVLSIGGGHKIHAILLWTVFRDLANEYPEQVEIINPDMQTKEVVTWDMADGAVKMYKRPFEVVIGLADIVGLYGMQLGNINEALMYKMRCKPLIDWKQKIQIQLDILATNKKLKVDNPGAYHGQVFELKYGATLTQLLQDKGFNKILEMYVGVKICPNDLSKPARAEYDILILDNKYQIYLLECKTNKGYEIKPIKAQKELAKEWGGMHAKFAVATNHNSVHGIALAGKIEMLNDQGIKTYLDINVARYQASGGAADLLRDWGLL